MTQPSPTTEMLVAVANETVVLRFDGAQVRKMTGLVIPGVVTDEFEKSELVQGVRYDCTFSKFVASPQGAWRALVNYTGSKVATTPPLQDQLFEIQVGTDENEGKLYMTVATYRQIISVEKAMEISRMFETAAREHIQWRLKR